MSKTYTLAEVETHNTKGDLWLLINGKVYDVSSFAADHPGGEEAIYEEAGTDASQVFEDIGHSDSAIDMLKEFYIGDLAGAKPVEEEKTKSEIDTSAPVSEKKCGCVFRVVLPTVIVAGLLIYKYILAPQNKH